MTRFCSRRLTASATLWAFARGPPAGASAPIAGGAGSCIEPDWSIRNRKQDGFVRLISALYAIALSAPPALAALPPFVFQVEPGLRLGRQRQRVHLPLVRLPAQRRQTVQQRPVVRHRDPLRPQ